MSDLVWPEHPVLRQVAETLEADHINGEVMDHKWRAVFASTAHAEVFLPEGRPDPRYLGLSFVARGLEHPDVYEVTEASSKQFAGRLLGEMLHDVPPDDPDFDEVFREFAPAVAERVEPQTPRLTASWTMEFRGTRVRHNWAGIYTGYMHRLYDDDGSFVGFVALYNLGISMALMARLARGDLAAHQLMDELREPQRRPAAILFADLEASGPLSRKMSSQAYFTLVRDLRDLIDRSVSGHQGLLGKHAGDGASALFLAPEPGPDGESAAALHAIEAAREIRSGADALGGDALDVQVNVGLHWGATLTVGQISTMGRLEVTAMGDEMNECARIESAATEGALLASKDLLERLGPTDADSAGIDPGGMTYMTIAELVPDGKVARDAGQIPVARL